jgi:hypothetical protein
MDGRDGDSQEEAPSPFTSSARRQPSRLWSPFGCGLVLFGERLLTTPGAEGAAVASLPDSGRSIQVNVSVGFLPGWQRLHRLGFVPE